MRRATATVLLVALTACGGDDQSTTSDRATESQIYIALAWQDLDAEQRQIVCDLDTAGLEQFLAGLQLADGDPPETEPIAAFLTQEC